MGKRLTHLPMALKDISDAITKIDPKIILQLRFKKVTEWSRIKSPSVNVVIFTALGIINIHQA